jgi:hypothetical protein
MIGDIYNVPGNECLTQVLFGRQKESDMGTSESSDILIPWQDHKKPIMRKFTVGAEL